MWLWRAAFGDSLVALRILPGLAGAATVFATGFIARELGGGRSAQLLAALAVWLAPFYLAIAHFYSMNAFDVLFWCALFWLAARILLRDERRLWLWFGAIAGLGLENKYSVAFLAFGLVVGLLATGARRQLATREIWIGGAIAVLLFAPHVAWEAANGAPSLEFMHNAATLKNARVTPLGFVGGQLVLLNPLYAPLWVLGLAELLFGRRLARVRALGIAYLALLALFIAQQAKVYYLGPFYPLPFAAGAVGVTDFFARRGWRRASALLALAVAAAGALALPVATPVLSPEGQIAYAAAIRASEPKMERNDTSRLPQMFAFMLGWPELAREVARVYDSLSPEERAPAAILGRDYAEAGAIDYYGRALGLPPAISPHNSYWLWGPGRWDGRVLIITGAIPAEWAALFESVEQRGHSVCALCEPAEADLPILVARGLRIPVSEVWARIKHFE